MSNAFNQDFNTPVLTLTAQAAGTSAQSTVLSNNTCRGVVAYLNVTSLGGGAPTVQVQLFGIDPVSGLAGLIGQNNALTVTTGVNAITFYPGVGLSTQAANEAVPRKFAFKVVVASTGSVTGTLSASLVV